MKLFLVCDSKEKKLFAFVFMPDHHMVRCAMCSNEFRPLALTIFSSCRTLAFSFSTACIARLVFQLSLRSFVMVFHIR